MDRPLSATIGLNSRPHHGKNASVKEQMTVEPISKEEALKRFLARKAAATQAAASGETSPPAASKKKEGHGQHIDKENGVRGHHVMQERTEQRPQSFGGSSNKHRADRQGVENAQESRHLKISRPPQELDERSRSRDSIRFPASKKSRLDLVPGNQNTTTKEPMLRPPDLRLVTTLASKGGTLADALTAMNMGPSRRVNMLQTLTTRDVVMIPDLFEPSSGFVMPRDPWDKGDGRKKTIYQRLVEEIHFAGKHEARGKGSDGKNGGYGRKGGKGGKGKAEDKCFSTDKDGRFKDDANGLFKAWHKVTSRAAGDGLASGHDGNGHLIVNDRDDRWKQAQLRGEAPMYTAVRPDFVLCLCCAPCCTSKYHATRDDRCTSASRISSK
eukprot:SAG11_NODE_117_length_15962_cov_71.527925_13_plen_384_part_00